MKFVALKTCVRMQNANEARLSFPEIPGLEIYKAEPGDAGTYRDLYHAVGDAHLWMRRYQWKDCDFNALLSEPHTHVWLAKLNRTPVGFVELCRNNDRSVQIVFLGVAPEFAGKGIGKYLLSHAIREGWRFNPTQLQLYTRNNDGKYALENYLKRGFSVWKKRPEIVEVPRELTDQAQAYIRKAKKAGNYPGIRTCIYAYLRDSPPGVACRWLVYGVRQAIHRLKKP